MGKGVPPPDSERLDRIRDMFRKALGRELTAEEQRYLGFAAAADSAEQVERADQEAEAQPFKRAKSA